MFFQTKDSLLCSDPRLLSGLQILPNTSSQNSFLDPAEGATTVGDVVLEHREVGGVGSDPEGAATDRERRNPDPNGQGSSGGD